MRYYSIPFGRQIMRHLLQASGWFTKYRLLALTERLAGLKQGCQHHLQQALCFLSQKWQHLSLQLVPFYGWAAKRLVYLLYEIKIEGLDKLPKEGGIILISNHVSYVDGLIINAICSRKMRFIIDERIYHLPVVHYFMTLDRAIPIAPRKQSVSAALDTVSKSLQQGDAICIFPEGQLTYNGFMSHFRPGIEWMVKQNPVPIYPIYLEGLWGSIFSRKYRGSIFRIFPRSYRRRITVVYGEEINPSGVSADNLQAVLLSLRQKSLQK